jgi:hypothetical protein
MCLGERKDRKDLTKQRQILGRNALGRVRFSYHWFPFNVGAMKTMFALCTAALLVIAPVARAQDNETEEQLKEAVDAAKKMGVTIPDVQKLLDENAKEEAAEQLPEQPAAKDAPEKIDAAKPGPTSSSSAASAHATVDLPAGSAKGSLTFDGATAELKFASAFIDQKDERKPTIVLVTDKKLPTEKWTSEFDMMLDHAKWSGLVLFVDKEGTIYRTDVHTNGRQANVSGIFDVNIDNPKSKDLAGTAKTTESAKEDKLDVSFHATLK